MSVYDARFFEGQEGGSATSARRIVPVIQDLIKPASVLDVGCGVGHWPAVFKSMGLAIAHGIDGPWVERSQLKMNPSDFFTYDFAKASPPYAVDTGQRKYDLVISTEFLEHLDARMAAELVAFMCRLSDVVIVSAAAPGQGGTHHVNEQWPAYWADLFKANGFVACDVLRPIVWNWPDLRYWYAQNMIAYFRQAVPAHVQKIAERNAVAAVNSPFPLLHPDILVKKNDPSTFSVRELLLAIAAKFSRFISGKRRSS